MDTLFMSEIREQLSERKRRLSNAVETSGNILNLVELIQSVDSALERMDNGTYGICEVCQDSIEAERLISDPLITVCLDHLDEKEQRRLEQDIQLAAQIQRELLPKNDFKRHGWELCYHYSPAGAVSGDYCDIINHSDNDAFMFCLGDVSGKGIAASLLMSHLHAMFRSLSSLNLPLNELLKRANQLFCESTPASHYATLIIARTQSDGQVEICNAGHNYPLFISERGIYQVKSTGLPIGMFSNSEYETEQFRMNRTDTLLLFTDGVTESSYDDSDYGEERLLDKVQQLKNKSTQEVIDGILGDLKIFMSGTQSSDDITLMVVRRKD